MKLLIGLIVSLGMFIGFSYAVPTSDEETLQNLEMEWSKYSNATQKDADFLKSIMGPEFVTLYPQGALTILTPANVNEAFSKSNAAEPDGKFTYVYTDVKARVFGDVGIVTYKQKTTATGFKNSDLNTSIEMMVVDTWQKQSGKWKVLSSANVPRHQLPESLYKIQPIP
jgi:ketosteroid isomerase-like protein